MNLRYLRAKLIDSKHLGSADLFDVEFFKAMLIEKIRSVNFKQAVEDVSPFIYSELKRSDLRHWNATYFEAFVGQTLKASESKDYPTGIIVKSEHAPHRTEVKNLTHCKLCGVVIRKGSKTSRADIDAELCSKHRLKNR
ncbi:MAG: hypothetical protein NTX25_04335 [Proteobacteria bacterium]|nr:hypothetical protein [Pseudomonadota bacterium]